MIDINIYSILLALKAESVTNQKDFGYGGLEIIEFTKALFNPTTEKVLSKLEGFAFKVISMKTTEDIIDFTESHEQKEFTENCKDEEYILLLKNNMFYYITNKKIIKVNSGTNINKLKTMIKNEMHSADEKVKSYLDAIDIENNNLAKLYEADLFADILAGKYSNGIPERI